MKRSSDGRDGALPAGDDETDVEEIATIHDAELRRRFSRNGNGVASVTDAGEEREETPPDETGSVTAETPANELPTATSSYGQRWREHLSALRELLIDKGELTATLERAERRVYDSYTFQINIDDDTYSRKRQHLDSIKVTVLDYEESQANDENERLLPGTFTASETAHDRRIQATGGQRPTKTFDFKWFANENSRSAMVGDIGAALLRWRLGQKDSEATYEQETMDTAEPNRVAEVA